MCTFALTTAGPHGRTCHLLGFGGELDQIPQMLSTTSWRAVRGERSSQPRCAVWPVFSDLASLILSCFPPAKPGDCAPPLRRSPAPMPLAPPPTPNPRPAAVPPRAGRGASGLQARRLLGVVVLASGAGARVVPPRTRSPHRPGAQAHPGGRGLDLCGRFVRATAGRGATGVRAGRAGPETEENLTRTHRDRG